MLGAIMFGVRNGVQLCFIWFALLWVTAPANVHAQTSDPLSSLKDIHWTFLEWVLKGEIDEYIFPLKILLKCSIFSLELIMDPFSP